MNTANSLYRDITCDRNTTMLVTRLSSNDVMRSFRWLHLQSLSPMLHKQFSNIFFVCIEFIFCEIFCLLFTACSLQMRNRILYFCISNLTFKQLWIFNYILRKKYFLKKFLNMLTKNYNIRYFLLVRFLIQKKNGGKFWIFFKMMFKMSAMPDLN